MKRSAFRRVEPHLAGPDALGILVPPGARTLVIVRPRALAWDLLPARWDGDAARPPVFCMFDRDEAARLARSVVAALEDAAARGINPVETIGDAQGHAFQVWVRAAALFWIACPRAVGGAYRPLVLSSHDAARRVGDALTRVIWPTEAAPREYYFNTQMFK